MLKRGKIHERHNNSLRSESVVMLQLQHLLNRYEVNGLVLDLLANKPLEQYDEVDNKACATMPS